VAGGRRGRGGGKKSKLGSTAPVDKSLHAEVRFIGNVGFIPTESAALIILWG